MGIVYTVLAICVVGAILYWGVRGIVYLKSKGIDVIPPTPPTTKP